MATMAPDDYRVLVCKSVTSIDNGGMFISIGKAAAGKRRSGDRIWILVGALALKRARLEMTDENESLKVEIIHTT